MRSLIRVAVALFVIITPSIALAQQSRCADCHFANPGSTPGNHLSEWDRSAHARANVGCESCHGGNPNSFESPQAHQGILASGNPASPVHRWNLPATCGKCHAGPFTNFQQSKHYSLLRAGDRDVPMCTTCHGEAGADLLSPKGLEGQCAQCHGPGKIAARSDYPPEGRMMLEGIRDARALLKTANEFIRQVRDKTRRAALEEASRQAHVPLVEATQSGHRFVYDQLKERLDTARQRIGQLYEQLANPGIR